ncbi:uncharacterized protein ColSpa_11322 [Colletotrichum spaethianum]|uniref:C6 zinc finger domain-containing protein n=1 Tax=Colletotrichum spaethianum TaxID=700344 RepID=A0AA37PF45_9PEZI|nr:uncharacterized protein ColSpa_11322 [Colletotrichum spaethianum]GKT51141.1 hypothetical protein ColSpa_11322 [Colletotrichum spaethianum]
MFSLLSSLKSSGSTSVVFEEALKATALASASAQTRQVGLMAQAKHCYGRAVSKIGAALHKPATAQDDSVAVALLTLGIYEALVPDTTPKRITSHCRGSLVLLKYRAEKGVTSSLDNGLLTFLVHLGVLEIFLGLDGKSSVFTILKNAPWAKQGLVEPLLVRAVDFKEKVHSTMLSANIREASITKILQTGLDIVRDLEAAAHYKIMSPGPRKMSQQDETQDEGLNNFNSLLSRNSYASEAIIKGLYLTVRLDIIECILGLSIALGEPTREELSMLASLPHGLTALEQICEQIRIVFGFDGREPASRDRGIGFNVWCMFWPMMSVLKSGFADRDTKLWVMDKCSLVSQASGFGMSMYQMGWFDRSSVDLGTAS